MNFKKILPGFILSVSIAFVATFLENILPVHVIGASVIALFIGILINTFYFNENLLPGLKFTSKKILKLAIILLGASLSIGTILEVGKFSISLMIFTLLSCFGGGYFVGKLLGLNWKVSNLISAGTGICGGSAIAAIAPVIDADDSDIAFAMSATFIFDMLMILLFPLMGKYFGLNDIAYALWTGTAVNDTSSVVAASYAFSSVAGDFAVMVKLTRTLVIIPTVIIFSIINQKLKAKQSLSTEKTSTFALVKSSFPAFIIGFLALALLNSFGFIPAVISTVFKDISKFLMVCALAAIGLNTSFKDLKNNGTKPMLHGFIISALVVIVAYLVIISLPNFFTDFVAFV